MKKTVNYTPNTPDTCVPSTGVVCTYCKNKAKCPHPVPEKIYTKTDFMDINSNGEKKPVKKANNLFDD